jgi:hypothetical protein
MPTPSGVRASPTILKPSISPDDPLATIAVWASDAVAGRRIVAPRGTRLTRRT